MVPLLRSLVILTLTIASVGVACSSSPKADLIIIVGTGDKGEMTVVKGTVTYKINPGTGEGEPNLFAPGTLYLFRQAKSLPDVNTNPGELYRVDETGKFQKIGVFDLKKTDEELAKEYLSRASR